MIDDIRLSDIIASLERRGFVSAADNSRRDPDLAAVNIQVCAVIEELGEVGRHLRRIAQGREQLDAWTLALEGADVVIAAVCLLRKLAGSEAAWVIDCKLGADEARGYLHGGKDAQETA